MEATRSSEREHLLDNVREIAPVLAANAAESEEIRRLPTASVEAMREADLFRCPSPVAVGGLEVDPLTQVEVFEEVAAIDGAAGWNLMIGALTAEFTSTRVGDDAAEAIYGGTKWPIVAGLVWPRGKAIVVDGGYQVSGRWSFGSGIHQADWVFGGALAIEDGKPRTNPDGTPQLHSIVVPRKDATIHDNWHVAGLRGTGSCDYSIENVFVPKSYSWGFPGKALRGGPWTSLPATTLVATGHAGFALGIAKGVLGHLESTVAASSRSLSPSSIGERESFQLEFGRKAMAYDAARALVMEAHRAVWEAACAGQEPSLKALTRMRLSGAHATEVAVEVAQFGYKAAGASALFESNPIQRALRDILAAQQHIFVRDTGFADFAKARFASAKKAQAK